MMASPLRASLLPTAPLGPNDDPKLIWEWSLAMSFMRVRWMAIPLYLLLVLFFSPISNILLLALVVLTVGANAWLAWSLHHIHSAQQLNMVQRGATVLDWAITLGIIFLFSLELANWAPALLLLLVLTTGIRSGEPGMLVAMLLAMASVMGLVITQVHVHGDYDFGDAGTAWIAWAFLIVTTGCVGHGLLQAMRQYQHWDHARWDRFGSAVSRFQHGISAREWELLPLLAHEGLTCRQIAAQLHVSPETVKAHVHHLGKKLGVSGRHQVITVARQHGLLSSEGESEHRDG